MSDMNDDFAPDRQESNILWLTIYEGMLCQRRSKPTPGFKDYASQRKSTEGKISYVREKDHLNGYVTNFETKEKEMKDGSNKKYTVARVTFRSESGRTAILEVGVKSEFVARFAMCVENMDLKKPVWFRSFMDAKGSTAIYFKQDDEKISSNYTKENPNGLPAWVHDPITQGMGQPRLLEIPVCDHRQVHSYHEADGRNVGQPAGGASTGPANV
jgi:hypothetical protein